MKTAYAHTWLTGILLIFLLTPLFLTLSDPLLEPYPAVLFPDQGGKAGVRDNKVVVMKMEWSARNKTNGQWETIETDKLFDPIPSQFAFPILKMLMSYEHLPLGGPSPRGHTYKITPEEIAETKVWFSDRLVQLGDSGTELRFTLDRLIYDLNTRQPVFRDRKVEKILALD